MKDIILFLQNRATRAGAQTSLARLVVDDAIRALSPVVLIGDDGWLSRWCRERDIPSLVKTFPSSRSLLARLWGNAAFARDIKRQLIANNWRAKVIIANDHQDGLLAQAIAVACDAPNGVILRTPGMSKRDFFKYACDKADLIYAVGDELRQAAIDMLKGRTVIAYREGLADEEFLPAKPIAGKFPARVLVAGSEVPRKGWADWVAALDSLETLHSNFRLDCDFTGPVPNPEKNNLHLQTQRRSRFRFLGRVDKFRELVRDYELVVHPSRHESFGLAPIEVLAAGVPLLCSRTGAITQIQDDSRFLFNPGDIAELAARLDTLRNQWDEIEPALSTLQARVKQHFSLSTMATEFANSLSRNSA